MSDPTPPDRPTGENAGAREPADRLRAEPLGPDNPWPGLTTFAEDEADFFFGREEEAAELLRLVRRDLVTVLYGLSGLGKSSLLCAAVFPKLRAENGLPIHLRIDHDEASPHPVAQVLAAIRREAEGAGVEAPGTAGIETLWEYFHRAGAVFWSRQHDVVTPVLVFDQFEELFTLGASTPERAARTGELLDQLRDLIEGRTPATIKARLDAAPEAAEAYAFGQSIFRVVLSLREDFLADLDDLRNEIPSLANRMHLRRMTGDKALQVVLGPGRHLVDAEVAEAIVRFVAGVARPARRPGAAAPDRDAPLSELLVEPALLSLFCSELNEKRRAAGAERISMALLRANQTSILETYYERCMRDRAPAVRAFVEDELVTVSGYRDSAALDDATAAGMSQRDVDVLLQRRLLRVEERGGLRRVELAHDVLVPVVCASRDRRQQREAVARARREAARQRRRFAAAAALAGVFAALFVAFLVAWIDARRTLALTNYREGIHQLRDGRSRDGAASLASALRLYPQPNPVTRVLRPALDPMFIRTAAYDTVLYNEWPRAILPHDEDVVWAAFSPDGHQVVTASTDKTARVWCAATGALISELKHGEPVNRAAFSRDGRWVVTASADKTAGVWDAATGACRWRDAATGDCRWLKHDAEVRTAAFSPDGRQIVTAAADDTARLWDADTGNPIVGKAGSEPITALRHPQQLYAAEFSADGTRIITTAADGTREWNAETLELLEGPHPLPEPSAVSCDGTPVVTASAGNTARLEDHGTGDVAPFNWARFSPDGRRIVTACDDHTARLWDAASGKPIGVPLRHEDKVWFATFSPDGGRVVTASKDHTARLWDAEPGIAGGVPLSPGGDVTFAAFDRSGGRAVTVSGDTARLWDLGSGTPIPGAALQSPGDHVFAAAFSPDGTLLATAAVDPLTRKGTARLWNVATGTPDPAPLAHDKGVSMVTFSPDGTRIVTASDDFKAHIWETTERAEIRALQPHARVSSAEFSSDGRLVVTAGDTKVSIWDVASGGEVMQLPDDVNEVVSAAFSPDGTRIVTASGSRAQVWDVRSDPPKPIGAPLLHGDDVRHAAFSPDGGLVVTASEDDTVRLWDANSGAPVGEPLRHRAGVRSAAFSADGTRLITASGDAAYLWDVAPDAAVPADELAALLETIAGRHLDADGVATELPDRRQRLADYCARPSAHPALAALVEWFCADPATRPLSPRAPAGNRAAATVATMTPACIGTPHEVTPGP